MLTITKTNFINHIRCNKMLWLKKYKKKISSEPTESEKLNIEEGHLVGEMATNYPGYEDGYMISELNPSKALKETEGAIKSKKFNSYYEPAFSFNFNDKCELFLRVDILKEHSENELEIIEVKSSSAIQEIHYWDIAFQMYVLIKKGYSIKDISLMKTNPEYIRVSDKINLSDFFIKESVYELILKNYLPHVERIVNDIVISLSSKIEPVKDIGSHCKNPWNCPNLKYCKKNQNEDSVENLSRLLEDKRKFFKENNIKYINQISGELKDKYSNQFGKSLLSEKQLIQVEVSQTNKNYINKPEIKLFIDGLVYPYFHLDFEAYNKTIPPYLNMKVHQFLTFQASIHKESEEGNLEHFEFLQEDDVDPRLEMIKFLIKNLEKKGSILVYNKSFEESRIKELARDFPEFSADLLALNLRMVDLEVPFKKHYYSHEFAGSSSIKKVLPVLVPELSYDRLLIQNGADAQAIFRNLINSKYHSKDKKGNLYKGRTFNKMKKGLLEYCALDTMAMVHLLRKLKSEIKE